MITKPFFKYDLIYILQNNILSIYNKLYVQLLTNICIIKLVENALVIKFL